jgi:hypothetical protein
MGHALGRSARHDPVGHLYLSTIRMVLGSIAATSFAILLLFSLPSCLQLCTTPFSKEGVEAGTSSLYSSNISHDTDPCCGYCTSTRTFHSIHASSFSLSSDVPFVFLVFSLFFLPNLLPPPTVAATSRRRSSTWVRASRSCSWPLSVHAAEEDTVAPATLRLSWRRGVQV